MATENIELEIELDSTYWNNPPICKIWLDDTVIIQRTEISEKTIISWSGNLSEGEHQIRISLIGKDGKQETIVEDGKIVKDQILSIKSIKLDQIELGQILYSQGIYATKEDIIHQGMVDLGWNGTYSLKFSVPVYLWLLENL